MNFKEIPAHQWPHRPFGLKQVWQSNKFLVQYYESENRLTINRVKQRKGNWLDDISWDQLMVIKRAVGFGDRWAVEVYPPDCDVVNVANMRHLWLLDDKPSYGWKR